MFLCPAFIKVPGFGRDSKILFYNVSSTIKNQRLASLLAFKWILNLRGCLIMTSGAENSYINQEISEFEGFCSIEITVIISIVNYSYNNN